MAADNEDWSKPAAMAIPEGGYFKVERGRYGPVFPRTPACYGFTIIAKVIPGREEAIREHGRTIQAAVEKDPEVLAPLKLIICGGSCSISATTCISSTRESSTPTSTSTPRMR